MKSPRTWGGARRSAVALMLGYRRGRLSSPPPSRSAHARRWSSPRAPSPRRSAAPSCVRAATPSMRPSRRPSRWRSRIRRQATSAAADFWCCASDPGEAVTYDFRETAPARASPTMFLRDGKYDFDLHHNSHLSVGVPGTVAGLHMAWQEHGTLPWKRLVEPAVRLAREGFPVSVGLARSLGRHPRRDEEVPGVARAVLQGRNAVRAGRRA